MTDMDNLKNVLLFIAELCICSPVSAQIDPCKLIEGNMPPINVPENTKVGAEVAYLGLTGYTGNVIFDSQPNKYVVFDASNQTLSLKKEVDVDSNDSVKQTNVVITCRKDDSSTPLDINFTINFIDVNDNPPVFSQSSYAVTIDRTLTENKTIFTNINATDADATTDNKIIYFSLMESRQPSSNFRFLNPTNSTLLMVLKPPDRSKGKLNFTIVAENRPAIGPKLSSEAELMIILQTLKPKEAKQATTEKTHPTAVILSLAGAVLIMAAALVTIYAIQKRRDSSSLRRKSTHTERLSDLQGSTESNADGPSDHTDAYSTFRHPHLPKILEGVGTYNLSGELQNGSGVLDEEEQDSEIRQLHRIANQGKRASVFTEPVKSISGTSMDSQFKEASDEVIGISDVDLPPLNNQIFESAYFYKQ